MQRAIRFYGDAFGIPVVEQSDDWSELGAPGATIGLHSGGSDEVTHTGLSVTVDDIEAAAKAVEAAGGKVIDVGEDLGGFRLAEFVDTENNYFMASGPA